MPSRRPPGRLHGADLAGSAYWIDQLASGARSREGVRRAFIATPEFSARAAALVSEGCRR